MVLDRADSPSDRFANDDRERDPAFGPVAVLCQLSDDLFRRKNEAVKLGLAHWPIAGHGQSDRTADDPGFPEGEPTTRSPPKLSEVRPRSLPSTAWRHALDHRGKSE